MFQVFTVMVLEPCCEKSAPGYVPASKPYFVRTSGWSDTCGHGRLNRRVPVITRHEDWDSAYAEFAKTQGWDSTDGWLFEGEMPSAGERFRIMPANQPPVEIPFCTVNMAREYADRWHEQLDGERHQEILYNVVGDLDTRVRWSSYAVKKGLVLGPTGEA